MVLEKAQAQARQRFPWEEVTALVPIKRDPEGDPNTGRG